MISKEEFLKLYCVDEMARMGIPIISADKIGERMRANPVKTKKDLDDYGLNDAMRQNGISKAQVLNVRSGEKLEFTSSGDEDLDEMMEDLLQELEKLDEAVAKLKKTTEPEKQVRFTDLLN